MLLAYGGGSVKKNGIYDELKELLAIQTGPRPLSRDEIYDLLVECL